MGVGRVLKHALVVFRLKGRPTYEGEYPGPDEYGARNKHTECPPRRPTGPAEDASRGENEQAHHDEEWHKAYPSWWFVMHISPYRGTIAFTTAAHRKRTSSIMGAFVDIKW